MNLDGLNPVQLLPVIMASLEMGVVQQIMIRG
jgi:hypothetical protein